MPVGVILTVCKCCYWCSCWRCCRWCRSCLNDIYRHSSSDTADKQASARQAARQLNRLLRTPSTSMRGREAKSARTCIGSLLASFLIRHACHKLLLNHVGLGSVLHLLLNVVSPADFLVDVSSHNSSTAWSMPSPTSWLLAPWCSPTGFPEHHLVDTVALQTATRCPLVYHTNCRRSSSPGPPRCTPWQASSSAQRRGFSPWHAGHVLE
mmetsp:Transcript_88809/g.240196  ORF Transcript_88809/g.240196 Transcript_88809/m.240196 type:complete len:209 (-) Transcript_88809:352-978(-)